MRTWLLPCAMWTAAHAGPAAAAARAPVARLARFLVVSLLFSMAALLGCRHAHCHALPRTLLSCVVLGVEYLLARAGQASFVGPPCGAFVWASPAGAGGCWGWLRLAPGCRATPRLPAAAAGSAGPCLLCQKVRFS